MCARAARLPLPCLVAGNALFVFPRQKFTRERIKKKSTTRCEQRGATPVLRSRTRRLVTTEPRLEGRLNVREIYGMQSGNQKGVRESFCNLKLQNKTEENACFLGTNGASRRRDYSRERSVFLVFILAPLPLSFKNDSTRKLDSRQQVSDGEKKRPSLSMRASVRYFFLSSGARDT